MTAHTVHTQRRPPLLQTASAPDGGMQWLDRVKAIAPVVREHREQAERDRVTPTPVIDVLRANGLHRMWVGRHFGGGNVSLTTGSAVLRQLARLDASVAWQMGVQGAIGRLSDYLPEAAAHAVFAEHTGLVVGSVRPAGRARAVPGGYRLTGTWPFASGSAHADWLVCAAQVPDGAPRMLFVPRSAVRPRDTWHSLGLRGTGSNHFDVDDAFVPEEFTVDGAAMLRPPPSRASRAYAIGYYDFGPFTSASTVLGIAQDAVETFRELLSDSGTAPGGTVHAGYARAQMRVRRTALLLADAARRVSAHGQNGGEPLSALVKLTAATVAEDATAAVDSLYDLAGARAVYTSGRLERCFRDIHTAVKHITLSSAHFETVGQYLLGDGPVLHH
ncbi:acyl-CoA dehydrogenase family protein [Streptomyces sp. NPDC003006]